MYCFGYNRVLVLRASDGVVAAIDSDDGNDNDDGGDCR